MRVLVLAGFITAATVPFAAASDDVIECQGVDVRRASAEQRLDTPPVAPAAAPARPAAATPRETVEAQRLSPPERRRGGKPVPDAQLMSPRGVL